jgi:hypothetical protein
MCWCCGTNHHLWKDCSTNPMKTMTDTGEWNGSLWNGMDGTQGATEIQRERTNLEKRVGELWWDDHQKTSGSRQKRQNAASLFPSPHPMSKIITERANNGLIAQGWISDKLWFMTDTRASGSIARLDITAGLPERDPPTWCAPYMASGETLSIL